MKVQKILLILVILILILGVVSVTKATDEGTKQAETRETATQQTDDDESETAEEDDTGESLITDWTDFSKAKMTFEENENTQTRQYTLLVQNVNFNTENSTSYYVFLSNSSTKPEIGNTISEMQDNALVTWHGGARKTISNSSLRAYLEKAGDIYMWIVESRFNDNYEYETKEVLTAKKIEKPEQGKLGSRMLAYFFSDETSTFLFEPSENDEARKMKVKIGTISDKSILKSIRDKEKNCLDKLMTYAKSAQSLYTGTVAIGKSQTITDKFDVQNEQYYYVYMELDDENGKYEKVEDVSLYQGLVGDTVGKNLFDYLSDEFKWELDEEVPPTSGQQNPPAQDNTVAKDPIPQTGETLVMVTLIGVTAIAGTIGFIKYRKYREVK